MSQPPNRDEPDGTQRFDPFSDGESAADRTRRQPPDSDGTQLFDPFRDDDRPEPDPTARYGAGDADVTRPVTPAAPGGDRTEFMPPVRPGDEPPRQVSPGGGQREMFPAGDRTELMPPIPPGATRATASVPLPPPPGPDRTSVLPPSAVSPAGPIRGSASVPPAGGGYGGYGDPRGGYFDDDDDRGGYGGPPPKKSNRGRTILIVAGVILAIILVTALGVVAGTAFFGGTPTAGPTQTPTLAPTTAAPPSPTPSASSSVRPRILSFDAPARVDCSGGQAQVTLTWEVKNASKVELKMDGTKVDDFAPEDSPSVPFPCDQVGHRYSITAVADDGTRSKARSLSVRPKAPTSTDGGTDGQTGGQTDQTGGN